MWCVVCGVWNGKCEVESVKCKVWRVSSVRSVECEECSVQCGVWSVEC